MAIAKVCPQCGDRDVFGNNNFCFKDGAKLKEVPLCQCGQELLDFYKFCPKCGLEIKQNKDGEI
jgi:predicted amidophosphoribosyltransferase